jgi:hypothetical protein
MTVQLSTERRWSCPNCTVEDVTHDPRPHSRFHVCKGLRGLTAPLVPAGTKAKVEAVERGDYIGAERVRLTDGRPVMAVITTRDDGQDVTVYAPSATGNVKE